MSYFVCNDVASAVTLPSAASFEEVILPHLDAAYNLARWLVRDESLAEDVVQDASLRAFSYFGSYRGGDGRAWLLRIVRNAAYNILAIRRDACATSIDDAGLARDVALRIADPAADPETALSLAESMMRLDQAIEALPIDLRECLLLHEFEELSYRDVAAVMGIPVGTVMSRLWRARQALIRSQGKG